MSMLTKRSGPVNPGSVGVQGGQLSGSPFPRSASVCTPRRRVTETNSCSVKRIRVSGFCRKDCSYFWVCNSNRMLLSCLQFSVLPGNFLPCCQTCVSRGPYMPGRASLSTRDLLVISLTRRHTGATTRGASRAPTAPHPAPAPAPPADKVLHTTEGQRRSSPNAPHCRWSWGSPSNQGI